MIKVLLATEYPFDESHIRGGIESVAYHLVKALQNIDTIDLHVVSFSNKTNISYSEKRNSTNFHWLSHKYNINGLQTIRLFTTDFFRLKRLYKKINPDIYHIQGFSGYALPCNTKDTVVITVHGVEAVEIIVHINPYYKGVIGFFRKQFERYLIKQCIKKTNCLVSNSGFYTENILNKYLNNNVIIKYIDHPIERNFFIAGINGSETEPNLLCVAGIHQRKRQIDLISAFKRLSEKISVKLTLMGPVVDKQYYTELLEYIEKLSLNNRVTIDILINQEKLILAYQRCTVFVLCSEQETAPMAIAAAMAAGKPIIATDVGGVSSMVNHGVNGYLVKPLKINDLANKLFQIISDPTKICMFGKNSRKAAESRFKTDIIGNKTYELYQELTTNK